MRNSEFSPKVKNLCEIDCCEFRARLGKEWVYFLAMGLMVRAMLIRVLVRRKLKILESSDL